MKLSRILVFSFSKPVNIDDFKSARADGISDCAGK